MNDTSGVIIEQQLTNMKSICTLSLLFCLLATCGGQSNARSSARCLAYEPQIVRLTGTLISKTYPGPPEYTSVRRGDEPETYWLVALPQPICVDRNDAQPYTYGSQKNIRLVQLVFRGVTIYRTHRKLLGRQVVATGTLYEANTIHHKTPVLLWVRTLTRKEERLKQE